MIVHTVLLENNVSNTKKDNNVHYLIFNPFPNKPWFFTYLQYMSFENTVEKGEIARNEQFVLFPQCFLPI